ncbi:MAG: DUF1566 domain-containing protein [Nitrospirae bacterium]|nr:DUF1566 domain-containing protein [Nitrospirota bacterium]
MKLNSVCPHFVLIIYILSITSSLYAAPDVVINQPIELAMAPRPPERKGRSTDGRFIDNGDGTISDIRTGLMWGKSDSYADLGKCLDWNKSRNYVLGLTTGGHKDWRLPLVKELKGIYDESKTNKDFSGNKIYLDPIFASGGAYWYWTSEEAAACCARYVDFYGGFAYQDSRDYCSSGGVRPVRAGH